ncbi:MAG: TonB-dependent receptor plug domain-containing protein, partial [Candidatus Aminicenantales bacterium]
IHAYSMPKEFLEKVPATRDFEDQLTFAPGAKGAWGSFYGSPDSLENKYLTDGLNTTNPEDGAPAQLVDYDSIDEFNVMGIAAPAEYGGFGGALINVVTKSGGNDFSGLFTFHMRDPDWHSENWANYPDLARNVFSEFYNVHFNLGGPIIKDKLWFYTSGRYSFNQDHIKDQGKGEKNWSWRGMAKFTWQLNKNNRLQATFDAYTRGRAGWTWDFVDPSIDYPSKGHGVFFNVSYLFTFSNTTFLEARLGGMDRYSLSGTTNPAAHFDLETEWWTDNYWEYWKNKRQRLDFNASLSHHAEDFIKGSHDFKFGVEFARMPSHDWRGMPGNRTYYDLGGEPYFMVYQPFFDVRPIGTRLEFFLQDTWSISDRVTINPGVRFMQVRGALPRSFDKAPFRPKLGIAPRLGINFDIFGDHTTVLKLHYGRYYHQYRDLMYTPWEPQAPYQEYVWGPVMEEWEGLPAGTYGEQWVLDFEDPWEPYKIDPNLRFPYMRQFVIGIERELGKDVSVSASFIYRTNHDLMDRVNIAGRWEPVQWVDPYEGKTYTVYQRLNPGENEFYITNPYKGQGKDIGAAYPDIVAWDPKRSNRTLEIRFNKRYSNRWQFRASFLTGYSWGNDDNFWGEYGSSHSTALGASWNFSNPNYQINAEGPLTLSSTYIFKSVGSYDIPVIDVSIGFDFRYESGDRYTKQILLDPDIDPDPVADWWTRDVTILAEPRGSYRLPAMKNLNLRAEKYFQWGEIKVGVLVDVFNVFNWDTVAWVETYYDPWSEFQFGYVWDIQSPRAFKLGFRFEF